MSSALVDATRSCTGRLKPQLRAFRREARLRGLGDDRDCPSPRRRASRPAGRLAAGLPARDSAPPHDLPRAEHGAD